MRRFNLLNKSPKPCTLVDACATSVALSGERFVVFINSDFNCEKIKKLQTLLRFTKQQATEGLVQQRFGKWRVDVLRRNNCVP